MVKSLHTHTLLFDVREDSMFQCLISLVDCSVHCAMGIRYCAKLYYTIELPFCIGAQPPLTSDLDLLSGNRCSTFTSQTWAACGHSQGLNTWGWARGGASLHYDQICNILRSIAVWLCQVLEECNFTFSTGVVCKLEQISPNPASRVIKLYQYLFVVTCRLNIL